MCSYYNKSEEKDILHQIYKSSLPCCYLQDICKEWDAKPEGERLFDPFYRSVSAVANSTGTRLKTRVHLLNQVCFIQGIKTVIQWIGIADICVLRGGVVDIYDTVISFKRKY